MKEIRNFISEILNIAMIDFLMVSSVFKKYNQFAQPSQAGEQAACISQSIKNLQYMDVFSQKLEHINKLHDAISSEEEITSDGLRNDARCDHANFIFKLNHLQSLVAALDFTFTVADLKKNLRILHDHIVEVTHLDFQEGNYFMHMDKIEEYLARLSTILSKMVSERIAESPMNPTANKQMMNISNLYTMDSERYVLLWLINQLDGHASELLEAYKRDGLGRVEEKIELF